MQLSTIKEKDTVRSLSNNLGPRNPRSSRTHSKGVECCTRHNRMNVAIENMFFFSARFNIEVGFGSLTI